MSEGINFKRRAVAKSKKTALHDSLRFCIQDEKYRLKIIYKEVLKPNKNSADRLNLNRTPGNTLQLTVHVQHLRGFEPLTWIIHQMACSTTRSKPNQMKQD